MENAFFVREQRQFARRRPVAWRWVGGTLFVMAAIVLGTALLLPGYIFDDLAVGAWPLLVPHTFLCWVAAGYGMGRVFSAENQIGTLEGVLLLPYAPARWLTLKMTFAATLVSVAWCMVLPLYVMAATAELIDASTMLSTPFIPLVLGLVSLPLMLLGTPEYLPRSDRATLRASVLARATLAAGTPVRVNTAGSAMQPQGGGGSLLSILYGLWLVSILVRGWSCLKEPIWFYGITLPEGVPWLLVTVLMMWAIAETGRALILGRDRYEIRASQVIGVTFITFVLIGVGAVWGWLPLNFRCAVVLSAILGALYLGRSAQLAAAQRRAVVAAAMAPTPGMGATTSVRTTASAVAVPTTSHPGKNLESQSPQPAPVSVEPEPVEGAAPLLTGRALKRRQREEPRIAQEVAWLLGKWDNAVWQKDIRTHLRAISLRSTNRNAALLLLGTAVVFYGAWTWLPRGSGGGFYQWPGWLIVGALMRPATLGFVRWSRESRGCTLLLLLLSPLSSREILAGRLAAAFVVGWLGGIPWLLALGAGLIWLAGWAPRLMRLQVPLLLPAIPLLVVGLFPLLVAVHILSIGNAHRTLAAAKLSPKAFANALHRGAMFVLFGGTALLCIFFAAEEVSLPLAFMGIAVLFALGSALCYSCFRLRVRQLDTLRHGDLPFDALRSHALAEPKRKSTPKGGKNVTQTPT